MELPEFIEEVRISWKCGLGCFQSLSKKCGFLGNVDFIKEIWNSWKFGVISSFRSSKSSMF